MALKKTAEAETVEPTAKPAPALPLFYKKPAALDKIRHAKAGVLTLPTAEFARETNSIAINVLEFIEAAKFYPIVFTTSDEPMPLAIVGLESDNYYVGKDGTWQDATYVPAYVRQYPFVFFENEKEEKFYLCIDEKAVHYRVDGGEGTSPLFNEDGTPSPLSNQALEFCSSYYRHYQVSKQFTADLVKHKLLGPYNSQVKLNSGRTMTLSGFQMIDENALNALSDEVYLEFRKKGWLPFIHFALASASNWNRIAGMANAREAQAAN